MNETPLIIRSLAETILKIKWLFDNSEFIRILFAVLLANIFSFFICQQLQHLRHRLFGGKYLISHPIKRKRRRKDIPESQDVLNEEVERESDKMVDFLKRVKRKMEDDDRQQ